MMICAAPEIELADYFEDSYRTIRLIGRSPRTIEGYKTALSIWSQWPGHTTLVRTETRTLAQFAQWILETRGAASANCYVRHIMAILRFAMESEDIGSVPRWTKLKEPKRVPLALTVEEFGKVLATAQNWRRKNCGYSGSVWWLAVLLTAWETGLRLTALLTLRTIDVLWDSAGLLCQPDDQKDSEGMWFALQPDTLVALRAIWEPDRVLLFPRKVEVTQVGRWFRRILDQSGIYAPKGCGLCFHRVRKSKASYTEAAGGDAQRALGHSARSVTERYLDPRIVGRAYQPPMPLPRPR
jgi:integrase